MSKTVVVPETLDYALACAQGEFLPIKFDKQAKIPTKSGREIKFAYASHGAIIKATQPALTKYGIALNHIICDGKLITALRGYGETIQSEMPLPSEVNDWKTFGGALTYAKRYARAAILDVAADEDVDADLADQGRPPRHQTRGTTQAPPPPETITAAEALKLAESLTLANADVPRFCAHFGISKVSDLPKARLVEATEMLETKIARRPVTTQAQENTPLPPTVGSAPPTVQQQPTMAVPPATLSMAEPSAGDVEAWVAWVIDWLANGGTDDRQALEAWWATAGDTYETAAEMVRGMDDQTRQRFDAMTETLLSLGLI